MSTAQDTITRAYRELNVTPLGITPTTNQLTEGLTQLNAFLRIIFGSKMGELLRDWEAPFQQRTAPVAANFPQLPYPLSQDFTALSAPFAGIAGANIWPYPPKNSRIVFGGKQSTTIYFPEQPDDGSRMGLIMGALASPGVTVTLDGNSRTINGARTQQFTTPFAAGGRWIYRADLGDWRPVADLALTDQLPFAEDMDDYVDISLAIRLAPKNDKTVSAETAKAFKDAETIFQARYRQEGTTTFKSGDIPTGYESFPVARGGWY